MSDVLFRNFDAKHLIAPFYVTRTTNCVNHAIICHYRSKCDNLCHLLRRYLSLAVPLFVTVTWIVTQVGAVNDRRNHHMHANYVCLLQFVRIHDFVIVAACVLSAVLSSAMQRRDHGVDARHTHSPIMSFVINEMQIICASGHRRVVASGVQGEQAGVPLEI